MQDRKHELLGTFKHHYKVAKLIAVLSYSTYLKSQPSQPVEFEIYPLLVITAIKCRHYAIVPPLYCGRLTRDLRGDFGRNRVG
jgi:hypothetical protein